jgi:hypothetical protein
MSLVVHFLGSLFFAFLCIWHILLSIVKFKINLMISDLFFLPGCAMLCEEAIQ